MNCVHPLNILDKLVTVEGRLDGTAVKFTHPENAPDRLVKLKEPQLVTLVRTVGFERPLNAVAIPLIVTV